jgi:hypothetical protein
MKKMRPKTIRIIESVHSKGVFGPCSCGGEVLYYTDRGVRCSTCGKLYGVWAQKQNVLLKRAKGMLMRVEGPRKSQDGRLGESNEASPSVSPPAGAGEYTEFITAEEDIEVIA